MIEIFQDWMQQESVTPVTQVKNRVLHNKSVQFSGVTPVTPVTHENTLGVEVTSEFPQSSVHIRENADAPISEGNKGDKGYNADSKTTSPVTHGDLERVTRVTNAEQLEAAFWEWSEEIEERAAIMEFDGGLNRAQAKHLAFLLWYRRFVEGSTIG